MSVRLPVVRDFSAHIYQDLHEAILRHHPVDITYCSRTRPEPTHRRVDPYGLTYKIGAWYLVGWCHLRKGIRTFGLDRIKWLRVAADVHFRYPADFDLDEWLAKGWQLQAGGEPTEVAVRFDRESRRLDRRGPLAPDPAHREAAGWAHSVPSDRDRLRRDAVLGPVVRRAGRSDGARPPARRRRRSRPAYDAEVYGGID